MNDDLAALRFGSRFARVGLASVVTSALLMTAGCVPPTATPAPTPTATAQPTASATATVAAAPTSDAGTPPVGTPSPVPDGAARIALPAAGVSVTMPVHLMARLPEMRDGLRGVVRWDDGTLLEQPVEALQDPEGGAWVLANLEFDYEGPPPMPPTQSGTVALMGTDGDILAAQPVTVLAREAPETTQVQVFWRIGEELAPVTRRVPRTLAVASAALDELLWGPAPPNLAGFETALPTPAEVLGYSGRQPGWGPRVTLLGLTVRDGLAIADFSPEMQAYGGGSARVTAIREQITRTLMQFETVDAVEIRVDGASEGVLQP